MAGIDLWQCTFMTALWCCHTERAACQLHALIYHSVTLSRHWAKQSLLYPNNDEFLARKSHLSILKSSDLTPPGFKHSGLNPPIPQHGRGVLYSFGDSIWSFNKVSHGLVARCFPDSGQWKSVIALRAGVLWYGMNWLATATDTGSSIGWDGRAE